MKSAPITLNKLFSKRTWKVILSWVLTFAVVIGAICGVIAVVKSIDSDSRTVYAAWARGSLDENGNYVEGKTSIYTKKAFECAGLDITLDFDSGVTYKVYFYTDDGDLLDEGGVTQALSGHFEADSVPANATYARVVVTPNDDANITWTEIVKYSNQVHITVSK